MDLRLRRDHAWAFGLGALTGVSALALARFFGGGRRLDPRFVQAVARKGEATLTVVVPGILGSTLDHPDGHRVWLDLSNALVWHDLRLPLTLPVSEARDALRPGPLVGLGAVVPRLFGFPEYADLFNLLESAGSSAIDVDAHDPIGPGAHHCAATYDWRHDLVASARHLSQRLESLAERCGDREARFDIVAHSMGGLVARYYLRYGEAEPRPDTPVTWAGARRLRQLLLVATPNEGSIDSLNAILNGSPVGFSYSTLSADVIAHTPSIFALLPPAGVAPLLDQHGLFLQADLFDAATWERFGWGPFGPEATRRRVAAPSAYPVLPAGARPRAEATRLWDPVLPAGARPRAASSRLGDPELEREYFKALLERARAVRAALRRPPEAPCPIPVVQLGGDCLLTQARAVVSERPGASPRFEPDTPEEAERMLEPGDGRVTRTSLLAAHLPEAADEGAISGVPEVSTVFLGAADHHGLYAEPTFQGQLLKRLLPARGRGVGATRPPSSAWRAHAPGRRRSS